MKIYVINLARSTTRRRKMTRRLENLGLDFEFVDAYDASQVDTDRLGEFVARDSPEFVKDNRWSFTPGTIGCALSHQICYRRMIAGSVQKALILEDDVFFMPGFGRVLQCLDSNMSTEDLVLLCYWPAVTHPRLSSKGRLEVTRFFSMYYAIVRNLHSAGGYAVGIDVARTLLAANTPIRFAADVWSMYYKRGGYKYLRVVYPNPIIHEFANDFGTRFAVTMSGKLKIVRALYKVAAIRSCVNAVQYLKFSSRFRIVSDPSPYSPEWATSPWPRQTITG